MCVEQGRAFSTCPAAREPRPAHVPDDADERPPASGGRGESRDAARAAGRRARRPTPPAPLLHGQTALHPGLPVARDGAVVRVVAGVEVGLELGRAAVLDDLALALA